ncbi:hypothetical protein FIBSPDRAFT_862666 [Athelia psychrophila]|uniref:Uncharacterized protein n=1 Tax=Athelia psychrophila TaxID=1759441 RepID=A0A166I430_9AGAM|nr:hypothetical protein FIBSPDRAFT_862666 [Fibularhizoctonia sp. CBS 109695]
MSPRLSSLTAVIGSLLFLVTTGVHGTNITCLPEYAWMNNGLDQNPCDIATTAQDACGGNWNINSFPPPAKAAGYYYPGPNDNSRSTCMCSTVLYSLFSACGVCQNGTYTTWTDWISNCSTVALSLGTFPEPIPLGTSIPAWAYLSVTENNNFDVSAAEADEHAPESTPIPTSTSTLMSTVTSTSTVISTSAATATLTSASAPTSSAPTPSSGSPSSSSGSSATTFLGGANASSGATHKSSDAGAIAGGVVGGVAVLGIIAGVVAFFVLRSRRLQPQAEPVHYGAGGSGGGSAYGYGMSPSQTLTSPPPTSMSHPSYTQAASPFADTAQPYNVQPYAQPDMQQRGSLYGSPAQNYAASLTQDYRPYDPTDPVTYPQSPPSPAQTSGHTGSSAAMYAGHTQTQPGRYNGMPEV